MPKVYDVKHRKMVDPLNWKVKKTKNNRFLVIGTCPIDKKHKVAGFVSASVAAKLKK